MNRDLFLALWVTVFVIRHNPGAIDVPTKFEGMTQAQITDMYAQIAVPFDFVDQATYDAAVSAQQKPLPTQAQILANVKTQASSLIQGGPDVNSELQRAVLLTILDQLNTIRAALPTPLSPITPAQAKTAVQNKLNSGAAD